jgi:uncharacterized integral membrane protein
MASAHTRTEAPDKSNTGQMSSSRPDRKRMVALGIIALVAIWLVAFILSNSETVKVSFVFGDVALSLIWVMIICAVLGGVLAWGIPRFSARR